MIGLEALQHFLVEPRLVAELDGLAHLAPGLECASKAIQPFEVFPEVARQLPDDHGKLVAKSRGPVAFEADGGQGIFKLLAVR